MFSALNALVLSLHAAAGNARGRLREEGGIEAIEYALIAALIAVAVIAAVTALNPTMESAFSTIAAKLQEAANSITVPTN